MPSFTSATILNASQSRKRNFRHISAPQTKQQKEKKALQRAQVQDDIDNAVSEWFDSTNKLANELAERFSKKPHYFLDIFC
jgi:hypothetical protein